MSDYSDGWEKGWAEAHESILALMQSGLSPTEIIARIESQSR